jgi:hypothetical protein
MNGSCRILNTRIHKQAKLFGILIGCIILIASICWIGRLLFKAREDARCADLWSSAQSGENADVERLLKEGLDPNCDNREAIKRARQAGHEDTVAILKRYGAKD